MITNPPIVVEVPNKDKTLWLLSFGGSNPNENECIELTEAQCFWLERQIMSIDPSLFNRAREIALLSAPE